MAISVLPLLPDQTHLQGTLSYQQASPLAQSLAVTINYGDHKLIGHYHVGTKRCPLRQFDDILIQDRNP